MRSFLLVTDQDFLLVKGMIDGEKGGFLLVKEKRQLTIQLVQNIGQAKSTRRFTCNSP